MRYGGLFRGEVPKCDFDVFEMEVAFESDWNLEVGI